MKKCINYYKQMRVILAYDLPMVMDEDVFNYNVFKRNLKKLGFYMIQFSIYTKVLTNETAYLQLQKKLNYIIPKKGSIIILKVTEKQFQNLIYLRGEKNLFETIVGGNELVIFKDKTND